jgi:ribosomal protein L11 methyltransferase
MASWLLLKITVSPEQKDALAELLWGLETSGFEEKEAGDNLRVYAFFSTERRISSFASQVNHYLERGGIFPLEWEVEEYQFEPQEWIDRCRENFSEFEIGPTFFIHPPWREPSAEHAVNIMMEPSHGFGTGTHESTQAALLALESVVDQVDNMLDVGTGSGILSIAGKKLNPKLTVTAFDIDLLATQAAKKNFRMNQVRSGVQLFAGDTQALNSTFQLVVANLTLDIFRGRAWELLRLGSRHFVLSGFTSEQAGEVFSHFERYRALRVVDRWNLGDWSCFHLTS